MGKSYGNANIAILVNPPQYDALSRTPLPRSTPYFMQNDECIEWQVNYGYQKCHEFLIQIQKPPPEPAIFSIFNS